MDSFYEYTKEEDSDDSIQYSFTTDHKLIYIVKFDAYLYQDRLQDYPNLLQNGYAFLFFPIDVMPQLRKPQDRKIWPTIHKIALDFIDTYGEDVVLLYHCAHKDNRHPFRNKLFLKWERLVDGPDSEMLRMCQTYQIGQNQSNPLDYAYLGAITSKRNPGIDLINREFDQFGVELLSGRK